jgi:hypothetical protein
MAGQKSLETGGYTCSKPYIVALALQHAMRMVLLLNHA